MLQPPLWEPKEDPGPLISFPSAGPWCIFVAGDAMSLATSDDHKATAMVRLAHRLGSDVDLTMA